MAKRQLSAIMFTDLAGYTAMMQEDEFNAKGIRDKSRRIFEKEIADHDGQILQYYGDGALSLFSSTVSASYSAIAIQRAAMKDKIPLRIGIHAGDVVIEDDGVFGDGVNIASRIESFAVPGSVMISDKVFDDIKNHQDFKTIMMGEFELKNVKRPVEVYALTNEDLVLPHRTDLKGKVKERIKSIAVLPFINRSSDEENEYFSDGITEEIITSLSRVEELRVISRTSSFAFKGKNQDIRKIGKKLEVQSVLEGSVRRSGKRVRISAQLSSTFDGYQLWTETYDRLLEDIFEVQDEIAHKIAQQLKERLASSSSKKGHHPKKINPDAHNYYLQGLFYYNKWTPANAERAVHFYEKAIELEADYDQAFVGIALCYILMSTTGYCDPETGFDKAMKAAKKALSLNKKNDEALVAISIAMAFYHWDWKKGRKNVSKALTINPKSPNAHLSLSLYSIIEGNLDQSMWHLEESKKTDPLSLMINRTIADVYYFKGEYENAIKGYDELLEQDPNFQAATEFKGWSHLMNKDFDKAIRLFESLGKETTHAIKPFVQLGYAHALKGDLAMAESYLLKLKEEAEAEPNKIYALDFATLYTGLNKPDEAFKYLEECIELRLGPMTFLNISPVWKPLKSDPRFKKMIKQVGLST